MIGPGFVERTVAVLANTGVLSITIALSNVIIAIATTIIIVVIIIIIILLDLDPRRRQVDEYGGGNGCRADQEDAEWQTNIAY